MVILAFPKTGSFVHVGIMQAFKDLDFTCIDLCPVRCAALEQ